MRRPLDRTQSIIGFCLFLIFLATGPIVTAQVMRHVYAAGVKVEQRDQATRHQVEATVVQRGGPGTRVQGQALNGADRVQWREADGSWHSGIIDTGRREGAHVVLWVDDHGAIKRAPQNRTQTVGSTGFAGAGALVAVAAPLALGYGWVRRRFDRRRFAAWDDEWTLIAPHWTGRS
ncbi:MAG TPA: hypothetical protein VFU43_28765 [Streptosporangiaceae bacterium]|nr:hypothetical protein [Streptosporangiaceae bacterium]